MTESPNVVVVGGGPAGLAAAEAAASCGASVLLVEERPALGGQLCYRAQPVEIEPGGAAERPDELARRLIAEAEAAGVALRTNALMAGCYGEFEAVIVEPERQWALVPDALVVATGSTDLPFPFAGATFPGVITRRAVQMLLNQFRVLPGRRFAIVGTGPEAEELEIDVLLAGGEVVWRGIAPAPLLRAEGDQGVQLFAVGPEQFDTDIIAIAVGRQADASLAVMAGASMAFAPELGGWIPVLDERMRCPDTRIFVAGDAAGVGSVSAAIAEGRLAGAAAVASLGMAGGVAADAIDMGNQELAWRMNVRAALEPAYAQPYE